MLLILGILAAFLFGSSGASFALGNTLVLNPAYSDEFNELTLDSKWFFDNPAPNPSGQSYSLTENRGFLRMTTTGPTDLIGTTDTAPKMLESAPDGDFQIIVRVLASPDVAFEHAGILVYRDTANLIRLIRDSNQNSIYLQAQGSSSAWCYSPFMGGDVILRLTKNGYNYEGAFSTDGTTFTVVGVIIHTFTPNSIGVTVVSTPVGNVFSADFDYFRVHTLSTLARATFGLDKNLNVWTEEDLLPSGGYTVDHVHYGIWIHNEDDDSNTVLEDLRFYVEASNMGGVEWSEYAVWDSRHANWTFPPKFIIREHERFRTTFNVEKPETVYLSLTISRWMNQTIFSSHGYQLVKFTVNFANTEFLWCWGHIGAWEHEEVNASIVPGTFQTDAPLDGFDEHVHWMHIGLNKDLIQPGVTYNFFVVVKVELKGGVVPPVFYKPDFHVAYTIHQERATGTEDYVATMPPTMLPPYVSIAQASTNTSSTWTLEREDNVFGRFREVSKPVGARATYELLIGLLGIAIAEILILLVVVPIVIKRIGRAEKITL